MTSKTDRARQLALEGKTRSEIMELIPCSKTTAFNAIKWAEKQRGEELKPIPPTVEITEEPAKPEFMAEAPPEEKEKEEAPPTEAPEIPMEVDVKDVHNFFDAMFGKSTWGEYGMDEDKTKSLANLWYPVFQKHWSEIVETWGLEIMAVAGTLFIVGGHIRSVRKMQIAKKPKQETE